ncbi:hypothetical protein D3C76_424940 [compost metagenome]
MSQIKRFPYAGQILCLEFDSHYAFGAVGRDPSDSADHRYNVLLPFIHHIRVEYGDAAALRRVLA